MADLLAEAIKCCSAVACALVLETVVVNGKIFACVHTNSFNSILTESNRVPKLMQRTTHATTAPMETAMPMHDAHRYPTEPGDGLEAQLARLTALTRAEFEQAGKLIDAKLAAAMESLQQSAQSIEDLLAAQSPADLESPQGIALRRDLEGLLANSAHLARLATMMQNGFETERQQRETRTQRGIANLAGAVELHRGRQQGEAIAMAEAALKRARASAAQEPKPPSPPRRP
jgi:hypothetical protein